MGIPAEAELAYGEPVKEIINGFNKGRFGPSSSASLCRGRGAGITRIPPRDRLLVLCRASAASRISFSFSSATWHALLADI